MGDIGKFFNNTPNYEKNMKSSETAGLSSEKTKKVRKQDREQLKKFGNKFGNTSKKFGN